MSTNVATRKTNAAWHRQSLGEVESDGTERSLPAHRFGDGCIFTSRLNKVAEHWPIGI